MCDKHKIENHEHEIIDKFKKNNKDYALLKCVNNHIFERRTDMLNSHKECPECKKELKLINKYNEMQSFLYQNGYKLISKIENSTCNEIEIECLNGHITIQRYSRFKKYKECYLCKENEKRINKLEEIKNVLIKDGHQLLSEEYVNNNQKLEIKCSNGHIYFSKWSYLQIGHRCPHCAGNAKITTDQAQELFLSRNYILLFDNIKNARTPLPYICDKHPDKIQYITYEGLHQGHGCLYCAKQAKPSFEEVKTSFEERGYILLETKYINSASPMRYICPNHPDEDLSIEWGWFKRGGGCPYCNGKSRTIEDVQKLFSERNYELLEEEYVNCHIKMRYRCLKHPEEIQYISLYNFSRGGCRRCGIDRISGENSMFWKGGVYEINDYLRDRLTPWKNDSMKSCEYKCVITGGKFDAIHHLYSFNKITAEIFNELNIPIKRKVIDYSKEELKLLEEKCLEIHYRYPLGVCLRKDIHKLYHKIYGFDNNPEQFEEFKQRFNSGEFNKELQEEAMKESSIFIA